MRICMLPDRIHSSVEFQISLSERSCCHLIEDTQVSINAKRGNCKNVTFTYIYQGIEVIYTEKRGRSRVRG